MNVENQTIMAENFENMMKLAEYGADRHTRKKAGSIQDFHIVYDATGCYFWINYEYIGRMHLLNQICLYRV